MLFDLYVNLSEPPPNISTKAGTGDLARICVPICAPSFETYSISLGVGSEGEIGGNIYR